jgi:hypothetical protein
VTRKFIIKGTAVLRVTPTSTNKAQIWRCIAAAWRCPGLSCELCCDGNGVKLISLKTHTIRSVMTFAQKLTEWQPHSPFQDHRWRSKRKFLNTVLMTPYVDTWLLQSLPIRRSCARERLDVRALASA